MRHLTLITALLLALTPNHAIPPERDWLVCNSTFLRGDVNSDGVRNLSDPVALSNHLFRSGPRVCLWASDADNSGDVNLSDVVFLYSFLFNGGPAPWPPTGVSLGHCTFDQFLCSNSITGGDVNGDGIVDLNDWSILDWALIVGSYSICHEEADVNGDSRVTEEDVEYLYNFLFVPGSAVPQNTSSIACWDN